MKESNLKKTQLGSTMLDRCVLWLLLETVTIKGGGYIKTQMYPVFSEKGMERRGARGG